MKLLVAALLCLSSGLTFAQDSVVKQETLKFEGFSLQLPGLSKHSRPPKNPRYSWNEQHPALGVEATFSRGEDTFRLSNGVLKDSLSSWGTYSGLTWQRSALRNSWLEVDAGAGVFLFYRRTQFNEPRHWVPALLPAASFKLPGTSWGANFLAVPKFTHNGKEMPAVIFLQLKYDLSDSAVPR